MDLVVKMKLIVDEDGALVERIARALARYRGNENWWRTRIKEAVFLVERILDEGST